MSTTDPASQADAARRAEAPAARPAVQRTVAAFDALQHRLMAVHADEFTAVDLTMAQAKLLYVVMAAGELTLTEIASRLRVSASTASGAVDHLVGLGLLGREDDPANRRQIRVSITPTGVQTIEQLRELGQRQMTTLFATLTDAELATLREAIEVMSRAVDNVTAAAVPTTS